MDNPFKSPVILSFCPGILGLERGLERVIGSFTVAAYCEIETFICANLVAGMESGILAPAPIWTDVKTFPAQYFHGKIHGIIGGYPCQPFSNAGQRRGTDDPRHLWPYIASHIGAIQPDWCFFENVASHLTLGYEQVKGELEGMGYTVKEGIYSAAEVGAPHRRERLFILAVANARHLRQRRCEHQSKKQQEKRPEELFTSVKLANTKGVTEREPINKKNAKPDSRQTWGIFGNSNWPARPGELQFDWEEPRTIKPSMGGAINGYNYREDFLRALGNSVVEQTAEIAFRSLLRAHFPFIQPTTLK